MADLPILANREASPPPPSAAAAGYLHRINLAIDHVMRHLDEPLRLEDVARAACFSPYHFHRIFRALVGETVHDFVKRVRLERALHLLSHRRGLSLTEVALACGFASSSDFSRSFRSHYGVAPRNFDLAAWRRTMRRQFAGDAASGAQHHLQQLPGGGENPDGFTVRLRAVPPRRVAYLRVFRPYEGDGVARAVAQLVAWARERGLAGGQWLGYQWDDPEIVPLEQCRYDVGLEIAPEVVVSGPVSVVTFAEMKLAELEIAGPIELEMRAIDWLYKVWLPASGYAPDHQPGFEAWRGEPFEHGSEHFELTVQLAVVDAGVSG